MNRYLVDDMEWRAQRESSPTKNASNLPICHWQLFGATDFFGQG
ncbi:MAG: hypothetical protein ACK5T6_20780 [Pirellula sp.]